MFLGVDLKDFFPGEYRVYSEELLDNKWLLLGLGIVLSVAGSLTNVKDVVKKKKRKLKVSYKDNKEHDISSHENTSFRSSAHSPLYKDSSHNSLFKKSPYERSDNIDVSDVHKDAKFSNADLDAEFSIKDIQSSEDYIEDQYKYRNKQFPNKYHSKHKEIDMKVDWTPLASGGSNFKTSTLKQINSSRLEVHKSTGGFLFSAKS